MSSPYYSQEAWNSTYNPTRLGGVKGTTGIASNWGGGGEDSVSSMIPRWAMSDPGVLKALGLTAKDFGYTPDKYDHDNFIPETFSLSPTAQKALKGTKAEKIDYGNGYTIQVLKDASGNILSMSRPSKPSKLDKFAEVAVPAAIAIGLGGMGSGIMSSIGAAGAGATGAGAAAAGGATPALNMAMIESGLGTAGYGFNAGAAASGAFNPAMIGAGALGGAGGLGSIPAMPGDFGAVSGTVGSSAGTSGLNPALIESMVGTPGYGASSAGAGGVTAGQTAVNAALNPYLNALGNISPALASAAGSATGGIGSLLGPIADVLLPASVLEKMGGGDGSTGGFGGGGGGGGPDWLKMLLPALAGYASYKDAKKPQLQGYTGGIKPRTATQSVEQGKYGPISRTKYAAGGIADAGVPRYLGSAHDGMKDGIAAHIDGQQPAALSGGEFVVPADVVSHIGNGNSNAGAKQLFQMMDRIRAARTGNSKQGKQINPDQFMPV